MSCSDSQLENLEEVISKNGNIHERYIDFSQVQLTRIFARGSMELGGRYYRGWWQTIPKKYRRYILIDGESTVECDYGTNSLRILYALKGLSPPTDIDLYDIGFNDWKVSEDSRREILKKYINATLNDEEGLYRLTKKQQEELGGLTVSQLESMLRQRHSAIYDGFENRVGLDIQMIDSSIAEVILSQAHKDAVLVLPVHDSFIVQKQHKDWLIHIMKTAYKGHFDPSIEAKIDCTEGILQPIEDNSIMGSYLKSWRDKQT